jgi:hypothetical protein
LSQEIKLFGIPDFDLRGNVKSSLVITDYGKEEYHFDESGRLTRSITRYSDSDYETTHYRYKNGELVEKRVENYRDKLFDKSTSLAHFYDIDTTLNRKVSEKIVSYTRELLERNVYRYDAEGNLIKIAHTDNEGTDQIVIGYDTLDGKTTMTRKLNGNPIRIVKTWSSGSKDGALQQVRLTETYFNGTPNTKTEEVRNANNDLVSSAEFLYDASTENWIPQEEITYTYYANGMLAQTETKRRNAVSTQNYIYQFDGTEANNWVKEIVTPDNTYTTRRIQYYKAPVAEEGN